VIGSNGSSDSSAQISRRTKGFGMVPPGGKRLACRP